MSDKPHIATPQLNNDWFMGRWKKRKAIHVIPLNDLRQHEWSKDCWCDPTEDDVDHNILVHHSADGREQYEYGLRAPS